jgi:hypothetical protein
MMAGFRKAKAEQAALKIGLYGNAGSGKSFTALLCAEGLAAISKKRIAYVDTERGTDFYCKDVPDRKVHPKAFDFDAMYTKSITEVLAAVKGLNPSEYGVIVIDSITHIWEAARLAYSGKETSAGTIPFHAWAKIKKPYKELINFLLSSTMHVFICGRQGNEFGEDEETGELKKVGIKMKAEGETPYEPHILIHMEAVKNIKSGEATITAFAEKDRTGVLAGRTIQNPCFDNLIKPILPLLGEKQADIRTDEETAGQDAEVIAEQDKEKESGSTEILKRYTARIAICENKDQLKEIGKEITPELKKKMTTNHVTELREKYLEAEKFIGK